MATLLISILIGMSSNLDNVGIGFSYGLRKAHVPWLFCAMVGLTSFAACAVGGYTASRLRTVVPPEWCSLLGSVILICLGIWTIIQAFLSVNDATDTESRMGFNEMMFVALAQGLSDLSVGFGIGFGHLNVFMSSLSVGLFSFVFLLLPILLGMGLVPTKLRKGATVVAGTLLITVGLVI